MANSAYFKKKRWMLTAPIWMNWAEKPLVENNNEELFEFQIRPVLLQYQAPIKALYTKSTFVTRRGWSSRFL